MGHGKSKPPQYQRPQSGEPQNGQTSATPPSTSINLGDQIPRQNNAVPHASSTSCNPLQLPQNSTKTGHTTNPDNISETNSSDDELDASILAMLQSYDISPAHEKDIKRYVGATQQLRDQLVKTRQLAEL